MEKKHIVNSLPEEYRPLSPWAYFGYQLLFAVPLIGLIFLIIFSFSNKNINRRNFARSHFCGYVLLLIIVAILAALGVGLYSFYDGNLMQLG